MYGDVLAPYADVQFIEASCKTPITASQDPTNSAMTCLIIELSGQGFVNLNNFMETWSSVATNGSGSSLWMDSRPLPISNLHGNTTAVGSWVQTEYSNMTESYLKFGRVINNVYVHVPSTLPYSQSRRRSPEYSPILETRQTCPINFSLPRSTY